MLLLHLGSPDELMNDARFSLQAVGRAGAYEWFTYEETEALVFHVASAMTECGVSAHEKCSIYGANCAQWMIAMQVLSASCPEVQGVVLSPPGMQASAGSLDDDSTQPDLQSCERPCCLNLITLALQGMVPFAGMQPAVHLLRAPL